MVIKASAMVDLGTPAPDFTLLDTLSNQQLSLADLKSDKATVVIFMCNHCPFVVHLLDSLLETARDYQDRGASFIGISSNDALQYHSDNPDNMHKLAVDKDFPFPYLFDESQTVAKAYDAACTPDFYVFDKDLKLVYRGRYDDSRPGNEAPVTGRDLRDALDNILAGEAVSSEQYPSMGCSIKWKA